MSYVKTTWAADTLITARLLRHAEEQYGESYDALTDHDHDDDYYTKALADALCYYMDGAESVPDGLNADMVDGQHASDLFGASLPSGAILMFSGADSEIPDGWVICNGGNGAPDLRGKFIVGAGDTYPVGLTDGEAEVTVTGTIAVVEHTLTLAEIPSHRHEWSDGYYLSDVTGTVSGGAVQPTTSTTTSGSPKTSSSVGDGEDHGHTGSAFLATAPTDNLPIYYALYYIMKV